MRKFLVHVLLPLVIVFLAVFSYFALATNFGIYQRVPWLHYLVIAAGCAWLATTMVQRRSVVAGLALLLALALGAAYVWYTQSYSTYASHTAAVDDGTRVEALAELELVNHRGEASVVLAPPETAVANLLVLYRGFW